MQRVSPAKKIPAQAEGEKKKIVQAENPPPPHHFSNGPSLILVEQGAVAMATQQAINHPQIMVFLNF